MLKSRLITAIILIALVLWVVFAASPIVYGIFILLMTGIAAWEWSGLIPAQRIVTRTLYVILIALGIALWVVLYLNDIAVASVPNLPDVEPIRRVPLNAMYCMILLCLDGLGIIGGTIAILTYPKTLKYWDNKKVVGILGFSLLIMACIAFLTLRYEIHGMGYFLSVLLLTWAADTGAYFAGKFWGQRKFSPYISPNKTWEGFFGGVFLGEVMVIISGFWFAGAAIGWLNWIAIGTLSILGAVFGDLLISMLKRRVGIKDTGKVLPGHGGVLDRIDSLLISVIIMSFLLFFVR